CLLWFFFSSRRRHTRFSRDWSSDVCSSDLSSGSCSCLTAGGNWSGMRSCAASHVTSATKGCGSVRAVGSSVACGWETCHSSRPMCLDVLTYGRKPYSTSSLVLNCFFQPGLLLHGGSGSKCCVLRWAERSLRPWHNPKASPTR